MKLFLFVIIVFESAKIVFYLFAIRWAYCKPNTCAHHCPYTFLLRPIKTKFAKILVLQVRQILICEIRYKSSRILYFKKYEKTFRISMRRLEQHHK